MVPLDAFGLACNVIQVVDASLKAYEIYTQIRLRGVSDKTAQLQCTTRHLAEGVASLRSSLVTNNAFTLLASDVDLGEISKKCLDTGARLEAELKKLQRSPASTGRLSDLKKTFKAQWKSGRINELKTALDELESVLDTKLLVHLSKNMGSLAAQQTNFDNLQQRIYKEILDGNARFSDLVKAISTDLPASIAQEGDNTRKYIANSLNDFGDIQAAQHDTTRRRIDATFDNAIGVQTQQHDTTRGYIGRKVDVLADTHAKHIQQIAFDDFMKSLHFEDINARQESILEAHKKTFEWIFDDTTSSDRPWDSFSKWARSDQFTYWILGKAGCGKSTLVNFLVQDPRTRSLFTPQSSDEQTMIISFFFSEQHLGQHREGAELRRNRLGLLRSLIWQIFTLMDPAFALKLWVDVVRKDVPVTPITWTQQRLRRVLASLMSVVKDRICLFLDGLDEFKDVVDEFEVVRDVISIFQGHKDTKICISSRPSTTTDSLYAQCPQLWLHHLTETDIRLYVREKLLENTQIERHQQLVTSAPQEVEALCTDVVNKAEGVFLWVRLVIESLIQGIRNEDDWSTLRVRIDRMPRGIYSLYRHMWQRLADDSPLYAKQAALYLRLAQHSGPMSLIQLAIAADDQLQESYLGRPHGWDLESLGKDLDFAKLERRLMARCAGFLEVQWRDTAAIPEENSQLSCTKFIIKSDEGDLEHEKVHKHEEGHEGHQRAESGRTNLSRSAAGANGHVQGEKAVKPRQIQNTNFPKCQCNLKLRQFPHTIARLSAIYRQDNLTKVSFLHRTAREYLRIEEGRKLLEAYTPSEYDLEMRFSKSDLILLILRVLDLRPGSIMRLGLYYLFTDGLGNLTTLPDVFPNLHLLLENLCGQLISTHLDQDKCQRKYWPFLMGTPVVDYIVAFMSYTPASYAHHRLSVSRLLHNTEYIDELLRVCVFRWQPRSHSATFWETNFALLLRLGANINQRLMPVSNSSKPDCDITLWIYIGNILRAWQIGKEALPILKLCLEAGANKDAMARILLSESIDSNSYWPQLPSIGNFEKSFMIWELRPWHLLRRLVVDADVSSEGTAAAAQQKLLVVYIGPARWCVAPADVLDLSWIYCGEERWTAGGGMGPTRVAMWPYGSRIGKEEDAQFFTSGIDALWAAGYSDQDIRDLPIPQTIWDDDTEKSHATEPENPADLLRSIGFRL